MHEQPRQKLAELTRADVPVDAGVYAVYRKRHAVYVGKASSLKSRFWGNHMSVHPDLTKSALRRNVAAHLGIASAADIKAGRYQPTDDELARIAAWVRQCDAAWILCQTPHEALALEEDLKAEWIPPLTKR